MCLQKLNVVSKIKVLCIKSFSNNTATLMLKIIESYKKKCQLNTRHIIDCHKKE